MLKKPLAYVRGFLYITHIETKQTKGTSHGNH
ncbi:hypothetical protein [Enterobacter phage vB_EcRAM-01]|nr:hypothetical protein [Enterobacter phage vB_EcRAM-01]